MGGWSEEGEGGRGKGLDGEGRRCGEGGQRVQERRRIGKKGIQKSVRLILEGFMPDTGMATVGQQKPREGALVAVSLVSIYRVLD